MLPSLLLIGAALGSQPAGTGECRVAGAFALCSGAACPPCWAANAEGGWDCYAYLAGTNKCPSFAKEISPATAPTINPTPVTPAKSSSTPTPTREPTKEPTREPTRGPSDELVKEPSPKSSRSVPDPDAMASATFLSKASYRHTTTVVVTYTIDSSSPLHTPSHLPTLLLCFLLLLS